jgi:hypothetical protein
MHPYWTRAKIRVGLKHLRYRHRTGESHMAFMLLSVMPRNDPSTAAALVFLNWRTLHGTVGAEDAPVAGLGCRAACSCNTCRRTVRRPSASFPALRSCNAGRSTPIRGRRTSTGPLWKMLNESSPGCLTRLDTHFARIVSHINEPVPPVDEVREPKAGDCYDTSRRSLQISTESLVKRGSHFW